MRTLLIALIGVASLHADSITANTSAEYNGKLSTCLGSSYCGSSGPGGSVTANAGFGVAWVDAQASYRSSSDYTSVHGDASFDIMVTIVGRDTGTDGLVSIDCAVTGFGTSWGGDCSWSLPRADVIPNSETRSIPGFYSFLEFQYGIPFEIKGNVHAGVTDGLAQTMVRIRTIDVFDFDQSLLASFDPIASTLTVPPAVSEVPEPASFAVVGAALLVLARGLRNRFSGIAGRTAQG